MSVGQIVVGSLMAIAAIGLGIYVSFTARKKGPIWSNTYLWKTKEERAKMSPELKAKEYKLVTIIYGALAVFFALDAVYILMQSMITIVLAGIVLFFVVGYAIADGVKNFKDI